MKQLITPVFVVWALFLPLSTYALTHEELNA